MQGQGHKGIARKAYIEYVAQAIPQIDTEIAKKRPFPDGNLHVAPILPPYIIQRLGNLAQGADLDGLH